MRNETTKKESQMKQSFYQRRQEIMMGSGVMDASSAFGNVSFQFESQPVGFVAWFKKFFNN